MEVKKDSGWYVWLAAAAILVSMTVSQMATYGTISVMVYIWSEKFNITTDTVVWAPSIMNGSMFLLGEQFLYKFLLSFFVSLNFYQDFNSCSC